MRIKEGEKIPNSKVFVLSKEGPEEVSLGDFIGEDKVILFGLPGAFTPTCSVKHLPSFVNSMDKVKKKGITKVICISINDPYVMDAWGKSYNALGKITMVGDSRGEFTKSIGAEIDLKFAKGLGIRSGRYTMLIDGGVLKKVVEEVGKCETTTAENFLDQI
ncbi:MAG: peroxiredoxin [Pelagibacteraceae bacterium]|jgi:peroxiredoxin (alkyl hydroperoxide reductase subunit C)|nr:peroxiredoxin [Candidatus Pelagibacter sp.]MDP6681227.1 peroxiredoxin [Pelagibacteraceae bacterium]MDP6710712.1 peroxiredoxin [Pelagibacteraceae bacterium]|tara:strand:- start:19 stop:501 length:483 start_codon:yes stop_codon:yes gene_type:complete